jgi:hypothetical protein
MNSSRSRDASTTRACGSRWMLSRSRYKNSHLEKHAVGFTTKLRKGYFRGCGRDKSKAVSRALPGCGSYANPCRAFEEIAGELIRWVAESDNAPGDPAPFDIERVQHSAHDISQRVTWSETIRDRERIEHGADIACMKMCRTGS